MSACRRHYPGKTDGTDFAQHCSIDFGLPQITVGSAPALSVSWPAQRSLTLRPTDSPSRLMRPSAPEAPTALLPSPPLRLLPGGAIQFPGGFSSRCGPTPFTAHRYPCLQQLNLLWAMLSNEYSSAFLLRRASAVPRVTIKSAVGVCNAH
jgi:hypothetical protein